MSVFKGQYRTIGEPVHATTRVAAMADPDTMRGLADELRTARDRARTGVTQAYLAREQAVSVEDRMRASIRGKQVRR